MNAHDGGIRTAYFPEPISVAQRYREARLDLPRLARDSRIRQDRQAAERAAWCERVIREALGDADGR